MQHIAVDIVLKDSTSNQGTFSKLTGTLKFTQTLSVAQEDHVTTASLELVYLVANHFSLTCRTILELFHFLVKSTADHFQSQLQNLLHSILTPGPVQVNFTFQHPRNAHLNLLLFLILLSAHFCCHTTGVFHQLVLANRCPLELLHTTLPCCRQSHCPSLPLALLLLHPSVLPTPQLTLRW